MTFRRFGVRRFVLGFLLIGCSGEDASAPAPQPGNAEAERGKADNDAPRTPFVASLPEGYDVVPGGDIVHKSCIHEVPNGAEISTDAEGRDHVLVNGVEHAVFQPCAYPPYKQPARAEQFQAPKSTRSDDPVISNKWVRASWGPAPENGGRRWFNDIEGDWTVPPVPAAPGGVFYLFNSLQALDVSPGEILQPVLQYGTTSTGGGEFWTVACWWVKGTGGSGNRMFTTKEPVNPGDRLHGSVVGFDCSSAGVCGTWRITMTRRNQQNQIIGGRSMFKTNSAGIYRSAQQGVLEVVSISSCNQYSVATNGIGAVFTNTMVHQPPPTGPTNSFAATTA
jgi:hypothetical protein